MRKLLIGGVLVGLGVVALSATTHSSQTSLFAPIWSFQQQTLRVFGIKETSRITPLSLLKKHHKVIQGTVCFYPLEVKCIDGLCGENGSYWEVSVNGDTKHYNANSTLKRSDRVRWAFREPHGKNRLGLKSHDLSFLEEI